MDVHLDEIKKLTPRYNVGVPSTQRNVQGGLRLGVD